MNCPDCHHLLDDLLDGHLPEAAQAQMHAHLAACPGCRARFAADQQLRFDLRRLPVPATPPGLAARVLPTVTARRQSRWPIAAAAALLLAFAALMLRVAPSPIEGPETVSTAPVRLVLRSPEAVAAVTIDVELPPGTRLAHAAVDPRHLRWQTDLKAGPNLLELPLVFEHARVNDVLIARISINGAARQFQVPVRSPRAPAAGARGPVPPSPALSPEQEIHHA